jgi:DnaJ homolog subfamily A member 1
MSILMFNIAQCTVDIEKDKIVLKKNLFFSRKRERRGKDLIHQLSVTLEELYLGAVRKLALQKSVICEKCEGRGGKKGAVEKCVQCRGAGIETKVQQLGPGLMQQFQQMCRACAGQGEIISAKDRCKTCSGKKTIRDRKILEVHVEKGMHDGQKIVFSGEGDQEPELQPGDIVIVLDEKEHPLYKRSSNDLIMRMEIPLVESLCGFQKVIKTLDQRDLVITSLPGEIVKHESFKCILGEGMPQYKNPFEKGRLIIQFLVAFPESLPAELLPTLEQCLPPRPLVSIPINAEECSLVDLDPEQENRRRHKQAYEEDDEDGYSHGPRIQQCSTS